MDQQQIIILAIVILAALIAAFFIIKSIKKKPDDRIHLDIKEEDKLHVTLADTDHKKVAEKLLAGLGGSSNVVTVDHDGNRLKATIVKYDAVDEAALRSAGTGAVLRPSKTAVHIIIGPGASAVCDAMRAIFAGNEA